MGTPRGGHEAQVSLPKLAGLSLDRTNKEGVFGTAGAWTLEVRGRVIGGACAGHIYTATSHPSSTFFFCTTKRSEAVSTTIGTNTTDLFLLHVITAAPFYPVHPEKSVRTAILIIAVETVEPISLETI